MSINVNVSGNPIRINRGKLVTATDLDYDKKEFDKRRRMRLEQVRHQSKEIAENVRNKVRKEKKKQLSDFEKREEEKLKQWQNRKLLELQQQYRESLNNIGLGHAQAVVEDTQENIAAKRLEELKEKAKERGQKARQKAQSEKNRESLKKAIPEQHKKLTRDVENARSSMVAKTKKTPSKKRKKKTKTNINITTNVSSSGASESGVEELDLTSDSDLPTVSEMSETGARRKRSKSKSPNSTYRGSSSPAPTIFTKADVHQVRRDSPKRSKSPLFQSIPDSSTDMPQYQEDTRISDRIMNRRYLLHPGKPGFESLKKDTLESDEVIMTRSKPYSYVSSEKRVDKSISTKIPENLPSPVIICQCNCRCNDHRDKDTCTQTEIPSKPTVSLKDLPRPRDLQKSNSKVQYYDHKNRFSKEVVAPKGSVKKIPEDDIDVCCHMCQCQEKQFQDKQFKNDRDAEIRGRKAAEKANVHKDYKQMLKQLPVLQKQERLARMAGDKPIFHMDNERLQDHERSKQNRMENAYERHFPKTITIPPKKHVIEREPFKAVDMTSKPNTDTLPETSKWDEDRLTDNGFTLTRDSGNIVIETDVAGSNKEDYLKYLLDRLKLQKEMLLREAANLPLNSNLGSIISGLESLRKDQTDNGINVRDTLGMTASKLENELPLPDTTEKKATKHKRIREQIPSSTSSSSTGSSPTKRRKHRKYRIVLQNTSTQTSPKTIAPETKPSTEDIQAATTKDKVPSTKISPTKKPSISSIRSDRSSKAKSAPKDRASSPIRLASPIAEKQGQVEQKHQKCKCKEEMQKMRATGEKNKSDVCEIVIKIQENEAPEISVKSPKKQGKDIIVKEISSTDGGRSQVETSKKENRKRFVKIDEIASTGGILKSSWREQFSRSDPAATSTSTSYFSPPDYSKSDFSRLPTAESTGTGKSYHSSAQSRRKIDPRLLTYIRKLLTMSRSSIDELGVSSASDFSTPSVTLTSDDSKYTSLNQLRSIIRYFNLNPQELAHYLSYSEDGTSTSISTKTPSTVHSSDYEASKSHVDANVQGSSNGGSKSSAKTTPSPVTQRSTPTPAAQYADLANLCEKRIAELAAMIDQVRMEKQQILSPTQSDKENSTQYMVLPSSHSDRKSPNTSSELEQAEINKRLLEIDYSLAEQLKVTQRQQDSSVVDDEEMSELDKELLERYRKLVNVQISDDKTSKKERLIQTVEFDGGKLEINKDITSETIIELPSPFTPILLDIPRLLISSVENSNEKAKKPPPAKGLMAAKRFNEDITTVAHELSTIIEVDSQLSTRLRQSSSPKPEETAPIRTSVDFDPTAVLPEIPPERNEEKSAKSDGSVPDIVAEIGVSTEAAPKSRSKIVQIQNEPEVIPTTSSKENIIGDHKDLGIKLADIRSEDSSTDKSEMDNIEIMLRSMGMGWAVSTLRKTKATFDMPSTSSSAGTITTPAKDKSNSSDEDNLKQSSNTSDITLRDMLGRKIFYTSSTNSEAQTPSLNLTKALTDLSVIQGSARSSDNKNQRTSTPIHTTKSSESKKEEVVTGGESELSSVKISDEFLTMPDSTNNSSAS